MNSPKNSLINLHLGLTDQNILLEIEMAAVGAAILANKIPEALQGIAPEMFCNSHLATIWIAIKHLHKNKKSCDYLTISEFLRKHKKLDEIGGISFIMTLGDAVSNMALCSEWAFHIRKAATKCGL